jgi:hypothetical protein
MRPVRRLTTLLLSCAVVKKSGNLNFLETSGPLQACNGTALPLPFTMSVATVNRVGSLAVIKIAL